jgi:hypothetical protein
MIQSAKPKTTRKKPVQKDLKQVVWTHAYQPFAMGGDVHQPIKTEVDAIEVKSIGKGFHGVSFKTPKGTIRIAEKVSGAIVGDTFEEVRKDIAEGDVKIMKKQVHEGLEMRNKARMLSNQEFFELYRY